MADLQQSVDRVGRRGRRLGNVAEGAGALENLADSATAPVVVASLWDEPEPKAGPGSDLDDMSDGARHRSDTGSGSGTGAPPQAAGLTGEEVAAFDTSLNLNLEAFHVSLSQGGQFS